MLKTVTYSICLAVTLSFLAFTQTGRAAVSSVASGGSNLFNYLVTLAGGAVFKDSSTDCSAPGLAVQGKTTTGLDSSAAATLSMCAGGVETLKATATAVQVLSTANFNISTDVGLARDGASLLRVSNGTTGLGILKANGTHIYSGSTRKGLMGSDAIRVTNDAPICWHADSDLNTETCDTGLSQTAAGVIGVGTGADGSVAGTITGASSLFTSTVTGHIYSMLFCGQGPNASTAVFLSPRNTGLFGDATCDAEDDTTEATADEVWAPWAMKVGSMVCGITDVANDATGVTFTLRSATADVGTNMSCVTGATDSSGFASCTDQTAVGGAYTIAAGATVAMSAVAATGNFTTGDIWCVVQYTQ